MAAGWIEQKRRYRRYKARKRRLPANYRAAVDALERYLTYYGAISKGDVVVVMLEDLVYLFEQSAATRTPIRAVVGDDPVEFAETFVQNYAEGQWINKERARLTATIDRVAGDGAGSEATS
jgi:DNA-binding ferritin-like protein (Dps family)